MGGRKQLSVLYYMHLLIYIVCNDMTQFPISHHSVVQVINYIHLYHEIELQLVR